MPTITPPNGDEPGTIQFGADDLARVRLEYSFRGVGTITLGVSFDEAEAAAQGAEIDRDLREWFFTLIRECVGEKAEATMEIIEKPETAEAAA